MAELRLVDLVKEFPSFDSPDGKVVAVDHVNLEVERGELVTLLGPSGCGKTTLLRLIAGFEDPTSGDIFLGERRINDLAPNRRDAAMVFQSYAIFPHLNVFENVAFGLRLQNLTEAQVQERVNRVLDLVGLTALARRSPDQLSGGQQQRVALARAIVMEPRLLLFDEPLSNLDAKLREQMRIEIRQLQQRLGITSVYVTHDQAEAMSISDRIVVMDHGRIEQVGPPLELYARPSNRFVAAFIGDVNFLTGEVVAPGRVRLLTETFPVADMPPSLRPGQQVTLTVRPESVELVDDPRGPQSQFSGEVRRVTFLGGMVEYEVHTEGLGDLVVHANNPILRGVHRRGDTVGLHIPPAALHVLP